MLTQNLLKTQRASGGDQQLTYEITLQRHQSFAQRWISSDVGTCPLQMKLHLDTSHGGYAHMGLKWKATCPPF